MSDAITADTTGGSLTTTQHAVVSSDGKGHDTIRVRAGSNATPAAIPVRAPLSQMSSTPRPEWLPANFANPEAMVKSYKELQAAFTQKSQSLADLQKGFAGTVPAVAAATPVIDSPVVTPTPAADPVAAVSAPVPSAPTPGPTAPEPPPKVDLHALSEEWAKNGGKLTARSVSRLAAAGIDEGTIAMYIEAQTALADKHRLSLEAAAGGSDRLPILLQWAGANQPAAANRYNAALANGDFETARLILAGLSATYTDASGRDPRLVIGGVEAGRAAGEEPFLSQQEMVRAMGDPRYGKDPAFTRSIERRSMGYAALRRQGKAL